MKKIFYVPLLFCMCVLNSRIALADQLLAKLKTNTQQEQMLIRSACQDLQKKNYTQAFELFEKAAPNDVSGVSSGMIGNMYEHALGVALNPRASLYWYNLALEKVSSKSFRAEIICSIGIDYLKLHDNVSAFQSYRRAAKMGNAAAQANLARMYAVGCGVIEDEVKAYAWLSVAIAEGLNGNGQMQIMQLKNQLGQYLWSQALLGQAQVLAKNYYKLYARSDSYSRVIDTQTKV